jgi:hypothetical protein
MKYQFVQAVYYYYEVEADSLDEAYHKTGELTENDYYDVVVGAWEECTPQTEEA